MFMQNSRWFIAFLHTRRPSATKDCKALPICLSEYPRYPARDSLLSYIFLPARLYEAVKANSDNGSPFRPNPGATIQS